MKRVIIVGGGYAGTRLARDLDASFDVVLVEPREAFVHNVAAIRALVEPDLVDRIILPYDRLLKRGTVVRGRAVAVADGCVDLADGARIQGDYVVLATGSTYAQPFKPTSDTTMDFRTASAAAHAAIIAAQTIAIVGAGAVGVELAGEIAATYNCKVVTLVSATADLFHGFPPGLGRRLEADLAAMGVLLRMGVMAHNLTATDRPHPGPLRLASGEMIAADLVIPALGARPVTAVLARNAKVGLDGTGRVLVDGWMRPDGWQSVFALGDMAANGDMMTIVAASRQAAWLATTLRAAAAGKSFDDLPAYVPWLAPPILIPLGKKRGASVLPVIRRGLVVGPFLTGRIKGRSLFIPRYRKEFGL